MIGPAINSIQSECDPWISPDGLELYFVALAREADNRNHLYVARRTAPNDPWAAAVSVGEVVNCAYYGERRPVLSPDGLLLFFCDDWTFDNVAQQEGPVPGLDPI